LDIQVLIPFVLYFVLLIAIGLYSSKFSSKGISEFFLGGRKLNKFVVALSAVVSGRSAWLLLGFTGLTYMIGLAAVWSVVGYILVEFLLFLIYAPKIRDFTEKNECITIPDFFEARFNDKSGILRITLVVIFLIFMVTYIAAQFVAGGKAFFAYFELNENIGLIITASIVLIYTILGGFLAVSLTDVVQAFFMLFILVLLPVVGIIDAGGLSVITNELEALPQIHSGALVAHSEGTLLSPFALSFSAFIGGLGIGLGSPGSPHVIVRYMSIKDPKQFTWTAIVGTLWNIVLAGGALFIGLIGRAYFTELSLLPNTDPENIYISLAERLLMPISPLLMGFLLASIFAAIMSTADSQLLVAASSVVRDIYQKRLRRNKELTQSKLTAYSRLVVTLIVILAVVLGIIVEDLVFWFVLFAWAGLGASLGPTSILALFWQRTTKWGVFAGLLSGTLSVFIWKLIPFLNQLIYELVPAFIISTLFTVVVSLLTKNDQQYKEIEISEISVDNIHEMTNMSDMLINSDEK